MSHMNIPMRVALGGAGGVAGSFALQALMTATGKAAPQTTPPIRQDPGEFMVERATSLLPDEASDRIPEAVETAAAGALALGYGLTFGSLYGVIRPQGGDALTDGPILGAACWAAGYAGWLPALGLMPPVWRQRLPQAVAPFVEHLAFGIVTVAAYNWMRERVG